MAKTNNNSTPLAKLTSDAKQNLDEMKAELEAAEAELDDLDTLNFDTARLRERIDWAKRAHAVLSKRL